MPAWMLAAAVDGSRVIDNLIVAGVAAIVAAVVSSVITSKILTNQIASLVETVNSLKKTIETLEADLADIRQERAKCELTAARSYATRSELGQVIAESAGNHREIFNEFKELAVGMRESVGKAHSRIDEVGQRLARVEAKHEGTPK